MTNFLLLLLLVSLGAGGSISIKIGLTSFTPVLFIFLRFALAIATLLPFLDRNIFITLRKTPRKVYLVSLLAVANVVLFAFGIRLTSVIVSSILYTLTPIIIGLLSHFFLKHRFKRNEIAGVLIGFIGALFIVLVPLFENHAQAQSSFLGNLILISAISCFALYTVLLAPLQKGKSKKEINLAFFSITFVLLLFGVITAWLTKQPLIIAGPSTQSILGLLFSGILSTSFFYLLYQRLIEKGGPLYASLSFYLNPIAASIFGAIILHERLTPQLIIGGGITFLGVWLYGRK
mgnify:CR=1 FL=1